MFLKTIGLAIEVFYSQICHNKWHSIQGNIPQQNGDKDQYSLVFWIYQEVIQTL